MMVPSDKFPGNKIILASRSPRRRQLLKELGIKFEVALRHYDESYPDGLSGEEIALHIAISKARSFSVDIAEDEIVITADTIVWCNGEVLGKPVDESDAKRILRMISGNTHEVITGVCIFSSSSEKAFTVSTLVTFCELSDEEIQYYIDYYNPYDKAGAYGIQEWIGIIGCTRIEGSYFNVVGLPVQRLYSELQEFVKL
jgi:septum formation protein